MAVTTGTRLNDGSKGITRWSADTDSLTRAQLDDSHYILETLAVKYDQGAGTGSRPTAALKEEGSFWYDTTNDALSYCDGTEWINIVLLGKTITGGDLILDDGVDLQIDTTTGTKIGTATNQKIGFFNATPITQPASTLTTRDVLINLGLLQSGGGTRLDHLSGNNASRPSAPTAGQQYYNTTQKKMEYYTGAAWQGVVPTGTIQAFYGTTAPDGWLFCDGGAISTDYSDLRTLVGTTTPDLRSKSLVGRSATTGTYGTTGDAELDAGVQIVLVPDTTTYTPVSGDVYGNLVDSTSSTVTNLTNVPPSGTVNWIIKT